MPTSVMPRGVEHVPDRQGGIPELHLVPTSVMPRGVEHWSCRWWSDTLGGCANLSDAERR